MKTSSPGEVSLKIEFEGSKVLRVIGESTKIGNVNNDKIISSDNKNMQPNESVQTGKMVRRVNWRRWKRKKK